MARVSTSTQKRVNLAQLAAELGTDQLFGPAGPILESTQRKDIFAEGVTEQALTDAVAAHTYDPEWGPEKDWRALLQAELTFLDSQIAGWPANANTNAEAVQRVNFLLAATKRLARNQVRVLRYIRDEVMDAGT